METAFDGLVGFSLDSWSDVSDDRHNWKKPVSPELENLPGDAMVLVVWLRNDKNGHTSSYSIYGAYRLEEIVTALVLHNIHGANMYAGEFAQGLEQWLAGE